MSSKVAGAPILCVVGARPNFMKIAPVIRALKCAAPPVPVRLAHTGQHYDREMNSQYFQALGIPDPDINLQVGSGSHAVQTADIMRRFEPVLDAVRPAAVLVVGDVNSTLACALVAVKKGVAVIHVEAGLRSFDRTMPEEINRLLTDAVAERLLVSERSGVTNLQNEGVPDSKIRLVGNVMIDTLLDQLPAARERAVARELGLSPRRYGLVTLHRPSNVDDPATLTRVVDLLHELARDLPLVFPIHPRTLAAASRAGIAARLAPGQDRLICLPPQPYGANLSLLAEAAVVLTDSGGLQEESAVLDVPCLTMRENTERPVTVELGTSRLVGNDHQRIRGAFTEVLEGRWRRGQAIPLWDGQAGVRVARELAAWLTPGSA
jgi:UDP-N-acetylglucosamine 2-epimerase (non-hydrolysing)